MSIPPILLVVGSEMTYFMSINQSINQSISQSVNQTVSTSVSTWARVRTSLRAVDILRAPVGLRAGVLRAAWPRAAGGGNGLGNNKDGHHFISSRN